MKIVLVLLLGGCGYNAFMACRSVAAYQMRCPEDDLEMQWAGKDLYWVGGCGKAAYYQRGANGWSAVDRPLDR